MRWIRFEYYCDNEAAGHQQMTVVADTLLVYSPKAQQVVELDVCDECLVGITHEEMVVLADKFGREIVDPSQDPELTCPLGCQNGRPFKDAAGKKRHMTRKHPEFRG